MVELLKTGQSSVPCQTIGISIHVILSHWEFSPSKKYWSKLGLYSRRAGTIFQQDGQSENQKSSFIM